MILAIDPGNIESAFVVVDDDLKPLWFDKTSNENILNMIEDDCFDNCIEAAIERVASYGMSVGKEVFETCEWVGRFTQALIPAMDIEYVYRREEKIALCGSMKAKDSNIRQALLDRFGVVGTKKVPGWFYGFKSDIWAAYAVAITYHDRRQADERVDTKRDTATN